MLLRRWERTDVACAREGKGCGPEEALAWIEGQWRRRQDGTGLSFAIAAAGSGEALGCVGVNARPQPGTVPAGHPDGLLFEPQRGTIGIGYWVLAHARRRGLASHAVALVARWALAEAGIVRIEALVEPANVASQRVVEGAGFSREGLLRAFLEPELDGRRADAYVYSLIAADTDGTGVDDDDGRRGAEADSVASPCERRSTRSVGSPSSRSLSCGSVGVTATGNGR